MAYPKLRRFGHLHRGEIGILLQTITPTLAAGLGLSQDWKLGILGVDITEATAGLMTGDAIHAINGHSVTSVDGLRTAVDAMKARSPGQFTFLAFELD